MKRKGRAGLEFSRSRSRRRPMRTRKRTTEEGALKEGKMSDEVKILTKDMI